MSNTASLPLVADRYAACVRQIHIVGMDLTGVPMRAQVRLGGDIPGAPLVDLSTVTNGNAEGLRLVSVDTIDGLATSHVELVINESTMKAMPYTGESGDATQLAWDWQITLAGRKLRIAKGVFAILGDGVTGADSAPANRASVNGSQQPGGETWSAARLTFGEETVTISIDGADLIAPEVVRAAGYADSAALSEAAAADSETQSSLAASAAQGFVGGVMYPTTAAGVAAVVDGAYFVTPGTVESYGILYRRQGAQAVEQRRFPSTNRWLHIRDFGADPANTAAANNAAIQAAIDTAIAKGAAGVDIGDFGDFAVTGLSILNTNAGLTIRGSGARLIISASAAAIMVKSSSRVRIQRVSISGNSGTSDNQQAGIRFDGTSDCEVANCRLEGLSVGIDLVDSATGYPLVGFFQRPSRAHGNDIRTCRVGIWARDPGTGKVGEYWRIEGNVITDCVYAGIRADAGNTSVVSNTVAGCAVGVWAFGAASTNGDHGHICNNTLNHNVVCGLYIDTPLRGWIVMGNHLWANLGGPNGNQTLAGVTGLSDGTQNYAFGMFIRNGKGMVVIGNDASRNQVNLGIDGLNTSVITGNTFKCAEGGGATGTKGNTVTFAEFDSGRTFANRLGGNTYVGAWSDTTTFTHNGAWDRVLKPTYQNGWADYGMGFASGGYWRDDDGVVHLTGLIKSGTLGAVAFPLPGSFLPVDGKGRVFPATSNDGFGQVEVSADGSVRGRAPSNNAWVSLNGISFRAL